MNEGYLLCKKLLEIIRSKNTRNSVGYFSHRKRRLTYFWVSSTRSFAVRPVTKCYSLPNELIEVYGKAIAVARYFITFLSSWKAGEENDTEISL